MLVMLFSASVLCRTASCMVPLRLSTWPSASPTRRGETCPERARAAQQRPGRRLAGAAARYAAAAGTQQSAQRSGRSGDLNRPVSLLGSLSENEGLPSAQFTESHQTRGQKLWLCHGGRRRAQAAAARAFE